jgi:hypothetical protein
MTDKTKEALKLALEKIADALPAYIDGVASRDYLATIHKALAEQPSQDEPVAWISTGPARMIHWTSDIPAYGDDWIPLYTSPPAQQEPVATVTSESGNLNVSMSWWHEPALPVGTKLYTSPPPQRKPLTDEEIGRMYASCKYGSVLELAKAIEAAHGIKGGT